MSEQNIISVEKLPDYLQTPDYVSMISSETGIKSKYVGNTLSLFENGATIPFIARYRKEMTGGLDEVEIGRIRDQYEYLEDLNSRRISVLNSISEQGKLTIALLELFFEATTKTEIEDLYLPYKKKRATRAQKAREKGLEPLADILMEIKPKNMKIYEHAKIFVNKEKGVKTAEEALAGAIDIVAERISENKNLREELRKIFHNQGILTSKVIKSKKDENSKFKDYFEFSEPVSKIPAHRILAVQRGENEEILRVHIEVEEEEVLKIISKFYNTQDPELKTFIDQAKHETFKRLLKSSLETDVRKSLKEKADEESIKVFTQNLREILMSPPFGGKTIMAVDPGFRTGCKVVVLSPEGVFLKFITIYPHPPRDQKELSRKKIKELLDNYKIEAVAIGNGTAGRETENFLKHMKKEKLLPENILIVRVDESGASIYSASPIAREEFPDLDLTVRGAISIGRRMQDPLAELVKIEPKSLGVGQYQHDVDQHKLKKSLDDVVLFCVNSVGVDLNTASYSLLKYVAGVGDKLSKSIVEYRNQNGAFKSRKALLKVPRLGAKAFEQCAGFLRINNGNNPLDASAVHPESYYVVEKMAKNLGVSIADLIGNKNLITKIDLKNYISDTVGEFTLKDILSELIKPGRDPRQDFQGVEFRDDVTEFEDLNEGMILNGVITNVTAFGAFVDIGVHQDGLVHISELSDTFVSDPFSVVKRGQTVKVKVIGLDEKRKRISLSIKACMPSLTSEKYHPHNKKKKSKNKSKNLSDNPFANFFGNKK